MRKTVVISDIHLGSDLCRADSVQSLLYEVKDWDVNRLILNGDVFDNHDFRRLHKKHWGVLSAIRKLSDDMEVIWVVGNHDGPLEVVSTLLGVRAVHEYLLYSGGRRLWVHHGDIHDTFILNNPFMTELGDWIYHTAQKINHNFARFLKRGSKTYIRNTEIVKQRAVDMAKRRKFDGAICGHTHLAEVDEVDGILYANSGSWTELPSSYLIVEEGRVSLKFNHE